MASGPYKVVEVDKDTILLDVSSNHERISRDSVVQSPTLNAEAIQPRTGTDDGTLGTSSPKYIEKVPTGLSIPSRVLTDTQCFFQPMLWLRSNCFTLALQRLLIRHQTCPRLPMLLHLRWCRRLPALARTNYWCRDGCLMLMIHGSTTFNCPFGIINLAQLRLL